MATDIKDSTLCEPQKPWISSVTPLNVFLDSTFTEMHKSLRRQLTGSVVEIELE